MSDVTHISKDVTFKKVADGRWEVSHTGSRIQIGFVFGGSNNWRAEDVHGKAIQNAWSTRRLAADFLLQSIPRNKIIQRQQSGKGNHA